MGNVDRTSGNTMLLHAGAAAGVFRRKLYTGRHKTNIMGLQQRSVGDRTRTAEYQHSDKLRFDFSETIF